MSSKRPRDRNRLPIAPPFEAPRIARTQLESCGPDDLFHDYVLLEYEPVAPFLGKLRSLNLLVESFAYAGLEAEGLAVISALRQELGNFRTVWGIKRHHMSGALSWELYFYDFKRQYADLTIEHIRKILAPYISIAGKEPRPLPWHMFSVELDESHLKRRAESKIDIYLDMRSYKSSEGGLLFENIYTFHESRTEIDDILKRLRACVHFNQDSDELHQLLPPHLFNCKKICVANKRKTDAVYFSRISTSALARFQRDQGWPEELQSFINNRLDLHRHLLWDVGVDFQSVQGRLAPVKTGIYGSF